MRWIAGILIALALVGLRVWDPYPIEVLRLKTFDYFISTIPKQEDQNIVLVNIDDESLQEVGQWPWPRNMFCGFLGAPVTGLSVLFPEKDRYDMDNDLARCIRGSSTVISTATSIRRGSARGPHVGTASIGADPLPYLPRFQGLIHNIKELEEAAAGNGITSTARELDGLTRRAPLVFNIQEILYPSFAMELLRNLAGAPSYTMKTGDVGVSALRIKGFPIINTDGNARIWINWNTTFKEVSAIDFLAKPTTSVATLVGVTAEGTSTLISTPDGLKFPHQVQASILSTLINGSAISRPDWAEGAEIMGLTIALLVLLLLSFNIYLSLPALVAAVGGAIWYTSTTFTSSQVLLDPSFAILAATLLWAACSFISFLTQYRLRQQIKKQFEHYLDPRMVKKLQKNPELLKLGGERRQMTFLFSDIRGFTPISESFKDNPEGLVELINRFLTNQTDIILKWGGTVDKYMGDCIMAFWNAPLDDENHTHSAISAAIEMREALEEFNEGEHTGISIHTGTGINTGDCIVGNMGSSSRFDYSVIGDAVNLAARLESQCKEWNTNLIISEYTQSVESDNFDFVRLGDVTVKGKSVPVVIYTIEK
tara:strand:- start:530 stop:2317 length:1788 start_codon:yes stop_codon:yes gene_type:complete